jgi:NADH-ubiquinone oxidoreductase chain 2
MINLRNVLIGFFSKQFVLYSALQNGYYFISLIAIIVSVISASYYLKIIKVLHTDHDYFEDKMLKGAVEENKAPNQSNVLLNEDKEVKEVKEFKDFKEGAKEGDCLTADIPIVTLILKEPKLGVESRVGGSLSQSSDPILLDLDLDLEQSKSKTTLTNTHSFVISSLTLIILLFFIKPSIILNSTQLLSLCAPYDGFCCLGLCLIPLVYLTANKFNDTSCWYSRLFKLKTFLVWIAEYKRDK